VSTIKVSKEKEFQEVSGTDLGNTFLQAMLDSLSTERKGKEDDNILNLKKNNFISSFLHENMDSGFNKMETLV
jgi:uncharacterized protein YehS (DUF1456 family)